MMGKVSGWVLVCGAGVALACSGAGDPKSSGGSSALYGGTSVPDASSVGVVLIEHSVDQAGTKTCNLGTGIAITHDVILTAAHVLDYEFAKFKCKNLVPKYLRFTMPDPSAPGGAQVRTLSCSGTAKEACGGRFHSKYETLEPAGTVPTKEEFEKHAREQTGKDIGVVRVGGVVGFNVAGGGAFYKRPISNKETLELYNKKVTCYGMSWDRPPFSLALAKRGKLRKADFTVVPHPHPSTLLPQELPLLPLRNNKDAFVTNRGGGLVETTTDPGPQDTTFDAVMVGGDSGGPCIEHTTGAEGPIVGIMHVADGNKVGSVDAPSWNQHVAASGFRDWARSHLRHQGFRLALDLDADGSADDGIEVRLSATNTLVIVASFNNGAQEFPLDTLFPANLADVGGTFGGDFNDDGRDDILGTIGPALTAVPYYFAGAPTFSFTQVPTWQPAGPYEYMRVGRYDGDDIDDVAAVRFDGSEDVFLGEKNVGLTVPAQFVPRGFNWYDPATVGEQETFAISAPGLESSGFWAGMPIQSTTGRVYFMANPGAGFEANLLDLDILKAIAPQALSYASVPGDGFGSSLAWGNFDGAADGTHTLVMGAPGVDVSGQNRAGMVTTFKNDFLLKCPVPLDQNGDCPKQPILVRQLEKANLQGSPVADGLFGVRLSVGDYNGDGRDDLAILSRADVHIIGGEKDTGLTTSSPQSVLSWAQLGVVELANLETAMTSGDFNCDGYEDLAVSGTRELVAGSAAGAVTVLYGSNTGLNPNVRQRLDKVTLGLANLPPQGERFGWALAAGNFNGDSSRGRPCVDLAIGVNEGTGSIRNGAVYVVTGGTGGLIGTTVQRLAQGVLAGGEPIKGTNAAGDGFGGFLAITRADLDRFDDLIIGAFNDDLAEGAAHVLRGSAEGITAAGQAFWKQGDPKIGDMAETVGGHPLTIGDRFGWNVGGTSNGLVIVGASWESFKVGTTETLQAGWAGLIRLDDSKTGEVVIKDTAFEATEPILSGNVLPYRAVSFFGREITQARPAFVPVTTPPPRYSGSLVLTSGGLRGICFPDVTPPVIDSVTASPSCMWPPNHKQVQFDLGQEIVVSATDYCDPAPTTRIVSVSSNEATKPNDIVYTSDKVCLRSTRAGSGARTYTVTVEVKDAAGNTAERDVTIEVPKSQASGCPKLPNSAFGCQ